MNIAKSVIQVIYKNGAQVEMKSTEESKDLFERWSDSSDYFSFETASDNPKVFNVMTSIIVDNVMQISFAGIFGDSIELVDKSIKIVQ